MSRNASQARSSDQDRLISGLARIGVVDSVDLDAALAVVRFSADLTSPPLQWLGRAGKVALWAPPSPGEQVLVICPEGDLEQGVVLGSLFSDANPAVASALAYVLEYLEGAALTYDPETHDVTLDVPGKVTLKAGGGFLLEGDLVLKGDVDLQGRLQSTGDVVAGDISLKSHRHGGVDAGTSLSGGPQ